MPHPLSGIYAFEVLRDILGDESAERILRAEYDLKDKAMLSKMPVQEPPLMPQYESWRCQVCGAYIGWLGRFIDGITNPLFGVTLHLCEPKHILGSKDAE